LYHAQGLSATTTMTRLLSSDVMCTATSNPISRMFCSACSGHGPRCPVTR